MRLMSWRMIYERRRTNGVMAAASLCKGVRNDLLIVDGCLLKPDPLNDVSPSLPAYKYEPELK